MALAEYGRYQVKSNTTIHLKAVLPEQQIDFGIRQRLFTLLQTPADYDAIEQVLIDNHVIPGLTSDMNMPSGFRHQETGKCLGWNTPAFGGASKDFVDKYLAQFDIPLAI